MFWTLRIQNYINFHMALTDKAYCGHYVAGYRQCQRCGNFLGALKPLHEANPKVILLIFRYDLRQSFIKALSK
jgi:hypothetical protein